MGAQLFSTSSGGPVSTLLHSTIRFLALFAESLTGGLLVVDVRAESVLPSALDR